ncbi:MAG: hypothetical protein IJU19_02270 [Bacteroidales bacterium]|nr:hypothetical protein [Bacteroidales bacterium]
MPPTACTLCPRRCAADRTQRAGYCGAGTPMEVASVCLHRGEEPPLNPIVNLFFAHCNLQCIYCQNHQISARTLSPNLPVQAYTPSRLASLIAPLLPQSGGLLGLVSAAHYADQLPALISALHEQGCTPTVVYNSGGYESTDTLRSLEGLVDIYLPDLKYLSPTIASRYSHAPDYPEVATRALLEMARQVGEGLKTDPYSGQAYRGLIVRHLVLPGATADSLQCLDWLASHFTPWRLHLSLMAQYYPPHPDLPPPLDRPVSTEEYSRVCTAASQLGFTLGWQQELHAADAYRPDFASSGHPFEHTTPTND